MLVIFFLGLVYLPSLGLTALLGAVLFLLGVITFRSISVAVVSDKETKVERNELEDVLTNLKDPIIIYDRDFNVTFFNPSAEKLFKLSKELVLGHQLQPQDAEKPAWRLLTQVIFPSLAPTIVIRSKPEDRPQTTDISFTEPPLEVRVFSTAINDETGKASSFIKIVEDRTHEVALLRSKTEFLTLASHQLRSPVTDIIWALQSLTAEKNLSENGKAILGSATLASQELSKIIEDLLNVAKIEEGHFGYNFQSANIVDFMGEILSQISSTARRVGVNVYFEKPEEPLPPVAIDPQKLSMAVNNILGNAIRYNVENGKVIVKVMKQASAPYVEVSVKDTGIGIPQAAMEKLFQKFFRAENALRSQTSGSGLGLYIAKNIIQAHGGEIRAESEENRGSVFHFTLPTDLSLVPARELPQEE